ncbi:MAG: GspH/FimT family pseudopilin [Rudaea sp.]
MKIQTQKTARGFTLIELMITLVVAAILCAVSFPALGGLVHSAESRAARDAMFATLSLARNTAVTRQNEIVVCPSSDQQTCDDDLWWHNGWIVFEDKNRDGHRDADETIIETVQAQPGMTIATSAARLHLTYRSDGTSPGTNATFTFCEKLTARNAGTIVVSNAGRARQTNPTAGQDAVCRESNPNA